MNRNWKLYLLCVFVALACGLAPVQPVLADGMAVTGDQVGKQMRLVLDTGDVVVGQVTGVGEDTISIKSALFGLVSVDRTRVLTAVEVLPESTPEQLNDPVVEAVEKAAEVPEPEPDVKWDNRLELGLNGSSGNTETFNFSGRLQFKRTTKIDDWSWNTTYRYSSDDGEDTDNRLDSLMVYDRRFEEGSRWSYFAQGQYEYDEFQDWDSRVSLFGGLAYRAIETETTNLQFRFGAGASREFGGGTEEWTPEGLLGFNFDHDLAENQRLVLYGTYFPSFEDISDFRTVAGGAYEIDLTAGGDLALRVGAENRYDTQPGDAKRSDVDYFARVVFKF